MKLKVKNLFKTKKQKPTNLTCFAENLSDYCFHKKGNNFNLCLQAAKGDLPLSEKRSCFDRVKQDFKSNVTRTVGQKEDIWQTFIMPRYHSLFENLANDNDTKAFAYMDGMFVNGALGGFATYGEEIDTALQKDSALNNNLAAFYMDTLLNFAEFLGVVPVENKEQGYFGYAMQKKPDEILDLIEENLKIKIVFPKYKKGLMAIKTSRGFFTNRDIIYLYLALKIKDMLSDNPNPKICEIGGGMGYLAYYLDMLGIKDITIVDIISTNLFANYFLRQNLKHRTFISGCSDDTDAIKFLLPEDFVALKDTFFDMVINCDSFPEISSEVVRDYLIQTKKITDKFYSVNQEANRRMWDLQDKQNVVPELIAAVNAQAVMGGGKKRFNRLSRNLFWLRRGYVEEVYEIV